MIPFHFKDTKIQKIDFDFPILKVGVVVSSIMDGHIPKAVVEVENNTTFSLNKNEDLNLGTNSIVCTILSQTVNSSYLIPKGTRVVFIVENTLNKSEGYILGIIPGPFKRLALNDSIPSQEDSLILENKEGQGLGINKNNVSLYSKKGGLTISNDEIYSSLQNTSLKLNPTYGISLIYKDSINKARNFGSLEIFKNKLSIETKGNLIFNSGASTLFLTNGLEIKSIGPINIDSDAKLSITAYSKNASYGFKRELILSKKIFDSKKSVTSIIPSSEPSYEIRILEGGYKLSANNGSIEINNLSVTPTQNSKIEITKIGFGGSPHLGKITINSSGIDIRFFKLGGSYIPLHYIKMSNGKLKIFADEIEITAVKNITISSYSNSIKLLSLLPILIGRGIPLNLSLISNLANLNLNSGLSGILNFDISPLNEIPLTIPAHFGPSPVTSAPSTHVFFNS